MGTSATRANLVNVTFVNDATNGSVKVRVVYNRSGAAQDFNIAYAGKLAAATLQGGRGGHLRVVLSGFVFPQAPAAFVPRGTASAHRQTDGGVHRDLKPSSVRAG